MSVLKSKIVKFIAIIGMASVLGSASSSANAGNLNIELRLGNDAGIYLAGNGHHRQNRYRYNEGSYNPYYQPRYNQRRYRHRNKHRYNYRNHHRQQVCGPRRAVNKAYRLGLNSPQIKRIKERRIVVTGYQYGYRTKMVFKRYSNCRLIKSVNYNR